MHARWSFLVETEALDGIDASNFESFWCDYYDNEFSDGDNWFIPAVIVNDTNEVVPICEEGAYRGMDGYWQQLMEMPIATRFNWALHFVAGCIAIDFEVEGARDDHYGQENTLEDIRCGIQQAIPSRLYDIYQSALGTVPPRPERDIDNQGYWEWYRRYESYPVQRFLKRYIHWIHAQEYDKAFGIFGYRANIRDGYRGMALDDAGYYPRDHEDYSPLSIVILDYHY